VIFMRPPAQMTESFKTCSSERIGPDRTPANSDEDAINALCMAGFAVDEVESVEQLKECLSSPLSFARHIGGVVSGSVDSAYLSYVTRFREGFTEVEEGETVKKGGNKNMFLCVFGRDAAMSVEMRTMLKSREVDMVTCWTDHVVHAMLQLQSRNKVVGDDILHYRQQIHDIFSAHDNSGDGMIDGDEQYEFAVQVAQLMVPNPGPERSECLNKIWDTISTIDGDGDGAISWPEFWRFVTRPDGPIANRSIVEAEETTSMVQFQAFVLVVLQRADGSFCLVDTSKGWWLIGGALRVQEDPEAAAIRLTKEQAGVDVRLEGLLRVEFDYHSSPGPRLRQIYLARCLNDYDPLKTIPDQFSAAAVWVDGTSVTTANSRIPLAGAEPAVWFDYILRLGPVYPLQVMTSEGVPPMDQLPVVKAHSPFADGHSRVMPGGEYQTTLGPIYPHSP